jgi:hypothetical protein
MLTKTSTNSSAPTPRITAYSNACSFDLMSKSRLPSNVLHAFPPHARAGEQRRQGTGVEGSPRASARLRGRHLDAREQDSPCNGGCGSGLLTWLNAKMTRCHQLFRRHPFTEFVMVTGTCPPACDHG